MKKKKKKKKGKNSRETETFFFICWLLKRERERERERVGRETEEKDRKGRVVAFSSAIDCLAALPKFALDETNSSCLVFTF